jgi:hypothetical protein
MSKNFIPDKGQVMIRYFGFYGNAHRGKVRKSEEARYKLLLTMVGWENRSENAPSASAAENQFLIF